MKRFLCLFTLIMLISVSACKRKESQAPVTAAGPLERKPAPEITVTPLTGNSIRLSELKGKVVLLNFWATWCPPCREEIPAMMKLNAAMAGKPFQMLAVSVDEGGRPVIEAFFRTSGYMLPAYTDPSGKASASYGITGVPETFIIDKNGIVVKKVIGPLAWDDPEVAAFLTDLMK